MGRYVKLDASMAKIRRKNRHNAIEREIIAVAFSIPNFRLPENG